jgi:hypothetical protein
MYVHCYIRSLPLSALWPAVADAADTQNTGVCICWSGCVLAVHASVQLVLEYARVGRVLWT